jgi:hypothetical protein
MKNEWALKLFLTLNINWDPLILHEKMKYVVWNKVN